MTTAKYPRIHISLDVQNLEQSVAFYRTLFDAEPTKLRDDYAKFEPAEPAVNLALNLTPNAPKKDSRVSHFGIQVDSKSAVSSANARLAAAGLTTAPEDEVTCCYAVQDKVWVVDPDGNPWEMFVVTQADSPVHSDRKPSSPSMACCPTDASTGCC
jgi:catechol 2,3-dioxygenase-like lactoylglutathione lyase family enzyme